ncbi:MAG: DUF4625 domain-containing protein [Salinivirgaceae bacterium]|nr:DUF4625 domain-containing protein [Salinivirgaceae bacterium]
MKRIILPMIFMCAVCACNNSDKAEDMTPPTITNEGVNACPVDCQKFKRGSVIPFEYVFTDDTELGNFNIEIHTNADHHTHSTSAVECDADEHDHEHHAEQVNPWVFNSDFDIPEGQQTYTATINIDIPADIDPGDYHFMVRLTDQAGWQQLKSMAIKIEE